MTQTRLGKTNWNGGWFWRFGQKPVFLKHLCNKNVSYIPCISLRTRLCWLSLAGNSVICILFLDFVRLTFYSKHFTTIHMILSPWSVVYQWKYTIIYHLLKYRCLVTITHTSLSLLIVTILLSALKMSFGGLWASSGRGLSRVLLVVQNWTFPPFHW